MNGELFKFYQLPSVSVKDKGMSNAKLQKEFQVLSTSLGTFEEVQFEWLLSFLESFLQRIHTICDNTALCFLKEEKNINSGNRIMTLFLDNMGSEYNEITRIIYRHIFDRMNQSYQLWAKNNPLPGGMPA